MIATFCSRGFTKTENTNCDFFPIKIVTFVLFFVCLPTNTCLFKKCVPILETSDCLSLKWLEQFLPNLWNGFFLIRMLSISGVVYVFVKQHVCTPNLQHLFKLIDPTWISTQTAKCFITFLNLNVKLYVLCDILNRWWLNTSRVIGNGMDRGKVFSWWWPT